MHDLLEVAEVARRRHEGHPEIREIHRPEEFAREHLEAATAEQRRRRQRELAERTRAHQAFGERSALVRVAAQPLDGSNDGANARAGQVVDRDRLFFRGAHYAEMREAAGPAGSEREADRDAGDLAREAREVRGVAAPNVPVVVGPGEREGALGVPWNA